MNGPAASQVAPRLARKAASLKLRLRALLGRGALPNAIIIGAMKSGTTSLFDYLVQHPQVCGSRTKELHFFDNQYGKGSRWYRANFAPRGEKVRLESSPYYLFHPLAAERAAALVPEAKLIVLLRNPVDRAYSHYNQNREEWLESLSFEEALEREAERLAGSEEALASGRVSRSEAHQTFSYVAKGKYAAQLQRWLHHYPRERMLILKAEDFFRVPQEGVDRVTDFLGLERFTVVDPKPGNQRRYPLMHPGTRHRLERIFEAPNEALGRLAGISWPRRPDARPLQPEEVDLQSPHLLRAPWDAYDALRRHGPVVWLPRQRFWLVVGHAAVREALERPDIFSSAPQRSLDPVLAGSDPPRHADGRALASEAFRNTGAALGAALGETKHRLRPELDAVSDFAAPVARTALAALLGVHGGDVSGSGDFAALCASLLEAAPQAEAYRHWVQRGVAPEEAASLFRLIWLAGTVTLERSIAWGAWELLRDEALRSLLRVEPGAFAAFVEEVLRLHPPNHMAARRTTGATQLAGAAIPAGADMRLCISAANRDPAIFPQPHRLQPGRGSAPHLAFGAGPHACMGAALAREILPAVFEQLLRGEPEPGAGEPKFLETMEALAPASVPLRLRQPSSA